MIQWIDMHAWGETLCGGLLVLLAGVVVGRSLARVWRSAKAIAHAKSRGQRWLIVFEERGQPNVVLDTFVGPRWVAEEHASYLAHRHAFKRCLETGEPVAASFGLRPLPEEELH